MTIASALVSVLTSTWTLPWSLAACAKEGKFLDVYRLARTGMQVDKRLLGRVPRLGKVVSIQTSNRAVAICFQSPQDDITIDVYPISGEKLRQRAIRYSTWSDWTMTWGPDGTLYIPRLHDSRRASFSAGGVTIRVSLPQGDEFYRKIEPSDFASAKQIIMLSLQYSFVWWAGSSETLGVPAPFHLLPRDCSRLCAWEDVNRPFVVAAERKRGQYLLVIDPPKRTTTELVAPPTERMTLNHGLLCLLGISDRPIEQPNSKDLVLIELSNRKRIAEFRCESAG